MALSGSTGSLCDFTDILTLPFYDSTLPNLVHPSDWTGQFGTPAQIYDSGVLNQAAGMNQFQPDSAYHPTTRYDRSSIYDQTPLPSIYQRHPSQIDAPRFQDQDHMTMSAGFDCLQTPPLSEGVHLQTGDFDGNLRLSHKLLSTECTDDGNGSWRSFGTSSPAASTPNRSGLSVHRRSPGDLCNPLAPLGGKIPARSRPGWKRARVPGSRK